MAQKSAIPIHLENLKPAEDGSGFDMGQIMAALE
jgi:hypothetical protein